MSQIHSKTIAKQITAATPAITTIIVLLSFSFSLLNLFSPLLGSLLLVYNLSLQLSKPLLSLVLFAVMLVLL